MRIGIDIRCLSAGKHSGVEEYIYNLLPNLFRTGVKDQFILFYNSFKEPISQSVLSWKNFPNVKIAYRHWPSKLLNSSIWALKKPALDRMIGEVDVMFFPNLTFFSSSKNTPYVLTFHDLSFEFFPNFYNPYRRLWHFMINPGEKAREAAGIITVSQSTAQDLTSRYGIAPEKISPIYLGLSSIFLDDSHGENHKTKMDNFEMNGRNHKILSDEWRIRKNYHLPDKPFILYLGTIEPRKNLVSLIRAYNEFRKKSKLSYELVIAGSKGWSYKDIFRTLKNSPYRKNIYFPGPIRNVDRPVFYHMASLFVFPSFFEGFGLPPLEAMACGTPVICSGSTSLLEVFGSNALLVSPHDVSEIAWAMERALCDRKLRESLISQGISFAKKFKWNQTASETLKVLHGAANTPR